MKGLSRATAVALLLTVTSVPALAASAADTPAPAADVGASLIAPALRSTDLDRSIEFYTAGLGMVVGTTLKHGPVTEVILGFGGPALQPSIELFRDETPGQSPPIDHGNGFGRIVLRVPNVAALSARMVAAGYPAGDLHASGQYKVLIVKDPDGYAYEIVELPAPQTSQ